MWLKRACFSCTSPPLRGARRVSVTLGRKVHQPLLQLPASLSRAFLNGRPKQARGRGQAQGVSLRAGHDVTRRRSAQRGGRGGHALVGRGTSRRGEGGACSAHAHCRNPSAFWRPRRPPALPAADVRYRLTLPEGGEAAEERWRRWTGWCECGGAARLPRSLGSWRGPCGEPGAAGGCRAWCGEGRCGGGVGQQREKGCGECEGGRETGRCRLFLGGQAALRRLVT